MNQKIQLSHFVVIGPGEWQSGTDLAGTIAKLRKRLPKVAAKMKFKVFASDAPMTVVADIYVRVTTASPANPLVEFDL
jgi:hypothetical protein